MESVIAFPLDISFSLSRAIKGNETGKPKLSPAGECLPIPKPFRSSLFPFEEQGCGVSEKEIHPRDQMLPKQALPSLPFVLAAPLL